MNEAEESKPIILVDLECQGTPGYSEWRNKVAEAGFHIVTGPKVQEFLRISPRHLRFTGDWNLLCLQPERLKQFKPHSEGQHGRATSDQFRSGQQCGESGAQD